MEISFEDLIQNPRQVLLKVAQFLKLNLDVNVSFTPQSNKTFIYKKKWQQILFRLVDRVSEVRLLKVILPKRVIRSFLDFLKKKASASPDSINESLRIKAEKALGRE